MQDLVYVGLTLLLAAATWGLLNVCEGLMEKKP
jgi:hypothetical protein